MIRVIGVPLKECLHLCHQLLDWETEHFRTLAGALCSLPITTPLPDGKPLTCQRQEP